MSRNLVEIVRRHHEVSAPTALEVLKDGGVVGVDERTDVRPVAEQASRRPAIASAS